jgi:hypothetical protein
MGIRAGYNPQTPGGLANVSGWLGHKVATSRGRAMVIEDRLAPTKNKKTIPTGETGKKPVLK